MHLFVPHSFTQVQYRLARLGAYPQSGVLYEAPLGQALPLLANVRLMEEVTNAQAYRTVVIITTVKLFTAAAQGVVKCDKKIVEKVREETNLESDGILIFILFRKRIS